MRFGITHPATCSYLADQQEQLLVFAEEETSLAQRYAQLIQAGFRRSGEQIYRPHCPLCQACESIRLPVAEFRPSRSQRRLLKKNAALRSVFTRTPTTDYYPLYARYIRERHADGSMYPPSPEQFNGFIHCSWNPPAFVEAYDGETLIAVAVCDVLDDSVNRAMSALYTFFNPDYTQASLGIWMILQQLQHAQKQQMNYVYLGYQIDSCQKMAYKADFLPHERFQHHRWHRVDKKYR